MGSLDKEDFGIEEVTLSIPKIFCGLGCSSKFLEPNFLHDARISGKMESVDLIEMSNLIFPLMN